MEPTAFDLEGILRELQMLKEQMENIEYLSEYLSETSMSEEDSDKDYRIIQISPGDADIFIPIISRELDMIEQSMKNGSAVYNTLTEDEFKQHMTHYTSAVTRRDDLAILKEYLVFYRSKI